MVETPDGDPNTLSPLRERPKVNTSLRARARLLNVSFTTFCRNEKKAAKKRLELKVGKDGVLWSSVCPRAKWSKILPQVLDDLRKWIIAHPDVL